MSTFYVRKKGVVSGPFDQAALQRMIQRGDLSRVHELSADRATWRRAGDHADLFAARPARGAEQAPAAANSNDDLLAAAAEAAQAWTEQPEEYYYSHEGRTQGPVAMQMLRELAQRGELEPDDIVMDASGSGSPARQFRQLTPWFNTPRAARAAASGRQFAPPDRPGNFNASVPVSATAPQTRASARKADRDAPRRIAAASNSVCKIAGLFAGAGLFLNLVVPWAVIAGHMLAFWNIPPFLNGATMILWLICLFYAGAGAVVALLGLLGSGGPGRASLMMLAAVGAVAIPLLRIIALPAAGDAAIAYLSTFVIPMAVMAIAAAAYVRAKLADAVEKVALGVAGASGALFSLIVAGWLLNLWSRVPNMSAATITSAFMFCGLFLLSTMAAGALAIVSAARQQYSAGLNAALLITSCIGVGALVLGFGVVFLDMSSVMTFASHVTKNSALASSTNFTVLIFLRFLLLYFSIIVIFGAGFFEWVAQSHA